jgi:polygalacturonase
VLDGVDPDSCSNVEISHSFFSAGDDGIAIKSGLNQAGRDFNMPSQNIYIHNITVKPEFDNGSTNGISIGSEMSGGVRNVTVNGASFHGVFAGLYIKSMDGRGGYVSNVTFMNVNITHTIQAIKFVMEYSYEKNTVMEVMDVSVSGMARPIGSGPAPVFDNFRVLHARGSHISQAGNFYGLSDSPLTNILLDDVVGLITLVTSFTS